MVPRLHLSPLLIAVAIVLAACASSGSMSRATEVPITNFKMVAGTWSGPVTGISAQHDDWVEVVITPEGRYEFDIYRIIGVFGGNGMFTLGDGKLSLSGERGRATLTLLRAGPNRWLKGQGVLADGRLISTTLTEGK